MPVITWSVAHFSRMELIVFFFNKSPIIIPTSSLGQVNMIDKLEQIASLYTDDVKLIESKKHSTADGCFPSGQKMHSKSLRSSGKPAVISSCYSCLPTLATMNSHALCLPHYANCLIMLQRNMRVNRQLMGCFVFCFIKIPLGCCLSSIGDLRGLPSRCGCGAW